MAKPLPLGGDFWRLQGVMLISALADACIFVAPIYWILVEEGLDLSTSDGLGEARDQVLLVMTWVPLARVLAQPLLAPIGDALPRGRVLSVALLLRAAPWVALGLLASENPVSRSSFAMLCAGAALSGLADATSLALVPSLVPPSEVGRALALSAGLPRAGFFASVVVGLLVVALCGVRTTLFVGAGLLAGAAIWCRLFAGRVAAIHEPGAWSPVGSLFAGRRVLGLALLAALTNFAVYPLYWVGPMVAGATRSDGDSLEVAIVAGTAIGLLALGVLARMAARRAIAASLIVLGLGLVLLATGQAPLVAGAAVGAGFSAANLLLVSRAIAGAPDRLRTRVAGLLAALFAGGGELGLRVVQPVLAGGAALWLPVALGAPLLAIGAILARPASDPGR
jgi:hypothetical protein